MNNYKLNLDIEPKDDYEKATKDWLKFLQSFYNLSPQEKERWVNEAFGPQNVQIAMKIMQMLGM